MAGAFAKGRAGKPILEGQNDRFWMSALTRALSPSLSRAPPAVDQSKGLQMPSQTEKRSPPAGVHFAQAQGGGGANLAQAPSHNNQKHVLQQPKGHMSLSELESAPSVRGGAVYRQLFGGIDDAEPTSLCSEARIASHRYQAARERFLQTAPADLAIARLSQSDGYMQPPAGHVRYSPPSSKSLPYDVRRLHSPPAPPPPARPLPTVPGSFPSRQPASRIPEPAVGRASHDGARDIDRGGHGCLLPRTISQTARGIAELEESAARAAPHGRPVAHSSAFAPSAPAQGFGRTSSMPVPKSPSSAMDQLTSLGISLQDFNLHRSTSLHHRTADACAPLNMLALMGTDAPRPERQQHLQRFEAGAAVANDTEAMQVEALLQHVEAIAAYAKTASKEEEQEILAMLSKTLELEEELLRRSGGRQASIY